MDPQFAIKPFIRHQREAQVIARIARIFSNLRPPSGWNLPVLLALGSIVFSDPEALKRLEALVHPATRERIALRMDEEAARCGKVVLEMTLLYRWPEMASRLDSVVGVRCPDEIRLDRLVARSGLDREEALRRMAAQVPQEQILAPATHVLDNAGTVDDLERGIDRFL